MKTSTARSRPPRRAGNPYICPLQQADRQDGCGAKAHNLARLLRLGFPVPPGLVVTDRALQRFLDANRLRPHLTSWQAATSPSDPETIRSASEAIRERILAGTLPTDVWEALHEALAGLLRGTKLIVRSSALGEDGARASFAGQLDSIAEIASEEALRAALLACWASYWSERSLSYQLATGVYLGGMGVIVQEQVTAHAAGVLFTRSPDGSGTDSLLAEYARGHGEALVAGRVKPGRVLIARTDLSCQRLAVPELAVALVDAQFAELGRAGLAVEKAFGSPQDIEWAIDGQGKLHLVQTRPITTPSRSNQGTNVCWSNTNVNENFPAPVSPLLYSIAADGYYHYFRNLGVAFGVAAWRIQAMEQPLRHLIGVHGARLYYNLTNIHAVLSQAPFGNLLSEFFNRFVGASPIPPRPARATRRVSALRQLVEVGRVLTRAVRHFLFLPQRVRRFERTADAFARATTPAALAKRSLPELLAHLHGFLDIRCNRWLNASLADAAAMLSYGALERVLRREFPEADRAALHNTLLKGLRDVVSSEPASRLWDLSRQVRADERLRVLFATQDEATLLTSVRTRPEFAAFRSAFESFLVQWGFRCSGELMLTVPSLQEEPARVLAIVKAYADLEGEAPHEVLRRQASDRAAQTERVLGALQQRPLLPGLPWPKRAGPLRVLLRWTQQAIALRERARLKQALLYSRCRQIALAIGEQLTECRCLEGRDDIFFLTHAEIDGLLAGSAMFPHDVRSLVHLRRTAHDRLRATKPPDAFALAEGAYLPLIGPPDDAPGDQEQVTEFAGLSACGGLASGPAAVLQDVSEFARLQPGAILVTRQTDPGWAPVFFLIKGLILERGGMLSHGAILAREYGIPTIVGVPDATRRITQGQTVTVNGDRGVVQLHR